MGHLEPHNFWLKQNKKHRELLEGVCTSERIIKLCPWGERALSCGCLPTWMKVSYFPEPFNERDWAHLSQISDAMMLLLTVPFGILGGGKSNLFSFWCWLIPSCTSLMYKWAFEFGSMNPAVPHKSTNKAVTMAILCCSDKPSMWKTLGLTSLKGKAKLSLLWELKAEKKEGAKKGYWPLLVVSAGSRPDLVGQSRDLWQHWAVTAQTPVQE